MVASRLVFAIRNFSSNSIKFATKKPTNTTPCQLVQGVARSNDGTMFVAWHPDVEFPYELSRPIPEQNAIDSGSLIKESALKAASEAFKNKHPEVSRQELMNLTHTTKHRWFPRARDKRAKKTPMDRKYL